MENKTLCLKDESGAILVVAMILLALLTIIGFMSINRTTTELEIAKNEVQYRRNFLRADIVNVTALGILNQLDLTDSTALTTFARPWLHNLHDPINASLDFSDPGQWQINANGTGINCQEVSGFQRPGTGVFDTHFAVAARKVNGGTVNISGSPLLVWQYEVFSRYASEDGMVIVHSAFRAQ